MTTNFYSFALGQEFEVTRPEAPSLVKGDKVRMGSTTYEVKAVLGIDAMLHDIERDYLLGWRPMHKLEKVS